MTIIDLENLIESDKFHHATYRSIGTVWEGLWIYSKDNSGFRGFNVFGVFPKDSPDLQNAHNILTKIKHGVSVGAYGQG